MAVYTQPDKAREKIRDYYRDADLWLPQEKNPSWRVFKFDVITDEGKTRFVNIKDRVDSKETLRQHLIQRAPLNVYWMVSNWMNPTKTRGKTYDDEEDGRYHADKNHFLFSDLVIDFDHKNTEEVEKVWDYLVEEKGIKEEDMYIVYSGGGYHINIDQWYRNRDIAHPIEREKHAYKQMQKMCEELDNQGFEFDYKVQNDSYNSPTGDTRRVRKLPQTITKYGNLSEVIPKSNLHSYSETKVMEFQTKTPQNQRTLEELKIKA